MIKYKLIFVTILLVHCVNSSDETKPNSSSNTLPVVLWHGMGDTCCFPFSLGAIKKLIEKETNGTYVKSLEIGDSIIEDYRSGFFIHPDKQIEDVCNQIQTDPSLQKGYNALGFSQGGLFLRALAEKCPNPSMKTLISFGGPHQGIFGLPKCPSLNHPTCEYIRRILSSAAYEGWVQRDFVQATYWHDPLKENEYRSRSTFLNAINNLENTRYDYNVNLQLLNKFIMVKFLNDTVVQPKESEWFEFYAPGQDKVIVPLKESELYTQDLLGLKSMNEKGKLIFLETEGDHLQFTTEWFIKNIIPYLV